MTDKPNLAGLIDGGTLPAFKLYPYQQEMVDFLSRVPEGQPVRIIARLHCTGRSFRPLGFNYAEASYFLGYHFQHVAAFQEHLRLRRIDDTNRRLWRERKGR